jgi:ABC-type Fe3+ transport system permease subunit
VRQTPVVADAVFAITTVCIATATVCVADAKGFDTVVFFFSAKRASLTIRVCRTADCPSFTAAVAPAGILTLKAALLFVVVVRKQ